MTDRPHCDCSETYDCERHGGPSLKSTPAAARYLNALYPAPEMPELPPTDDAVWAHFIEMFRERINDHRDNSIIVDGNVGCLSPETPVLMYDGRVERADSVRPGDLLMGPDSSSRTVLSVGSGRRRMVRVVPMKGESFVVTCDHVLPLVRTNGGPITARRPHTKNGEVIEIDAIAVNSLPVRNDYKLFRVGVDFNNRRTVPSDIPPYVLGALLGDGGLTEHHISFCSADRMVYSEVNAWVESLPGMVVRAYVKPGNRAIDFKYTSGRRVGGDGNGPPKNTLMRLLEDLGLFPIASQNRFVPFGYKTAGRNERLELLAGLMDTDGSMNLGCFDYITKSKTLADDVAFVARSLGMAAYVSPCRKGCQNRFVGTYFRVGISGDTHLIPCRLPRKQAPVRRQKKCVLRTGFTTELIGEGPYVGFNLDGDGRHLLGDFTVTKNSGKSTLALRLGLDLTGGRLSLLSDVLYSLEDLLNRLRDSNPGDVVVCDEAILMASFAGAGGQKDVFLLERALALSRELGVTLILNIPNIHSLGKGIRERRAEFWFHVEERGIATVHGLIRNIQYKDTGNLPFAKFPQPLTYVHWNAFDPSDPLWIEYSKLKHDRTLREIEKASDEVAPKKGRSGRGRPAVSDAHTRRRKRKWDREHSRKNADDDGDGSVAETEDRENEEGSPDDSDE